VGPMALKSEIVRPQNDAKLGLGTNRVFGVAWPARRRWRRSKWASTAARFGAAPN